jgi:GTP-binding protein
VVNEAFDLFVDLGASDEQSEFATVYTNGLLGHAGRSPLKMYDSLEPLFECILDRIPPPDVDADGPAQFLVTTSSYDDYKGKIVTGRLYRGTMSKGQPMVRIGRDGAITPAKITQLFTYNGLHRQETETATAGDIIAIAGLTDANIGETIADATQPEALPTIKVEEPTVRMTFGVNTSPFAGREGTFVTSRKLRERLYTEVERDVALRVTDTDSADVFLVAGRGELHLGILIENMRREGYEFQVSKPEVIFIEGEDGAKLEPMELVEIEVGSDFQGVVVEMLGKRSGLMRDMQVRDDSSVHYVYLVPTRGLLGFRQQFLTATRGQGILNSLFYAYEPLGNEIDTRETGSLIASDTGVATTYGMNQLQDRGTFFVSPGQDIYEGMVVGQHIRDVDLEVNICKEKHLNNMRNNKGAESIRLDTPRTLSLDDAIEYISDDELVEVTPKGWRIRKRLLNADDRRRVKKKRDMALA